MVNCNYSAWSEPNWKSLKEIAFYNEYVFLLPLISSYTKHYVIHNGDDMNILPSSAKDAAPFGMSRNGKYGRLLEWKKTCNEDELNRRKSIWLQISKMCMLTCVR